MTPSRYFRSLTIRSPIRLLRLTFEIGRSQTARMSTEQSQREPKNRQVRQPGRRMPPPPKPGEHRSPRTEFKAGEVHNPHGAPRKGMSLAETIRTIDAMSPAELRELLRRLGGSGRSGLEQALNTLPARVEVRFLRHLSASVQSICEPQPGILAYLRDTDEGKPVERQEIAGPNGQPLLPTPITFVRRRSQG